VFNKTSLIVILSLIFSLEISSKEKNKAFDTSIESECSFEAFVSEKDPKGLIVRENPDVQSKILGVISPAVYETPPTSFRFLVKPEIKVIASKNGWFKINEAKDNDALIEEFAKIKPRKMYNGFGWVSGKMLTIKSNASEAYDGPSKEYKILHKKNEQLSFDKIDSYKLLACKGDWVFVEDLDMKNNNRYWLNRLCGIQETSCDGI